MKKVLIIYKFLPEYRFDFFNKLKSKLLEQQIELNLIYGKFNKIDALRKNEVEIDWAQHISNRRLVLGKKEIIWQPCLNYLKDKDLIIVQPENGLILNYYLMLMRYFSKYKLAFWGHVFNMQKDPKNFGNRLKGFFNTKCDWWFGYTASAKTFLIAKHYPEKDITIVQNAIDTITLSDIYSNITNSDITQLRTQLGISGNNVAIYCGGMYPDKDFEFTLEACFLIKQDIPDFQMLFIGSGVEATKIESAAKKFNWIHYLGPKFGKERIIYFRISSIQLMPRLVGLCILDSFAMETPLITTDHPCHGPEINYLQNGVNGIMTQDDVHIYSNTVIETLKTKKYLNLVCGGKMSAQHYTVENMAENFKNGILSCLNLRKEINNEIE